MKRLLLLDQGNSRLKAALRTEDGTLTILTKNIDESILENCDLILLASVAPVKSEKLLSSLGIKKFQNKMLQITGENGFSFPCLPNPKKIGIDRMLGVEGALKFYKPPFVLASLGTALVLNFVHSSSTLWGGYILPGPQMALDALRAFTEGLPKLLIQSSHLNLNPHGKDTENAMILGALLNLKWCLEGSQKHWAEELKGSQNPLLLTGPTFYQNWANKNFPQNPYHSDLVFQGMVQWYERISN